MEELTPDLGRRDRRAWAATYVRGLLLDGDRKSIEPLAQRLSAIDGGQRDYEQALQQFISQSPWNERPVRDRLARWVARQLGTGGFLILDDTGFPKQGRHSVGVARQYSGTLGKVGNCQVAVTLHAANPWVHFGVDAELYLPEAWTQDRARLATGGVPASIGYQPKWQLGLQMLQHAQANGLSGTVLADSLFGSVPAFRRALDAAQWRYCVGIDSTLKVIAADRDLGAVPPPSQTGRPPTRPVKVRAGAKAPAVAEWASEHVADFRKVTWRTGTRGQLSSRFGAWRVRPAQQFSAGRMPLAACWLLAEWPTNEAQPAKYFFSNLPATLSLRQLVRTAKSRWLIEQGYQQMKEELGLEHFEGRSWRGWQHHVTLTFLAFAFRPGQRCQRKKGAPVSRYLRPVRRCNDSGSAGQASARPAVDRSLAETAATAAFAIHRMKCT